ncbi:hypothetical protein HK105_201590 [Polyrhizophydium stewartii]|uniref:WD40 repeat-like protein n=1 Tax=Polyrhizophydium stewartii TaxID=2732419 RepID=A0ABR4NGW4_9FUNG
MNGHSGSAATGGSAGGSGAGSSGGSGASTPALRSFGLAAWDRRNPGAAGDPAATPAALSAGAPHHSMLHARTASAGMQRAPLPQPFTPAGGAAYNDPALAQTLEDAVRRLAYDLGGSDLGADEHSDAASDSAAPGLHRNSDYSDAGSALEREPASDDAASTFSRSAPEHQPPMSDGRLADDDAASIPPSTAGPRTDGLAQTHSAAAADKKRSARSAPFFHIFKKGDRQRSTESFASSSVPARDQEQPADDPGASGPARSVHGIAREQSAWISHHPVPIPVPQADLASDAASVWSAGATPPTTSGSTLASAGQASSSSVASSTSGSSPSTRADQFQRPKTRGHLKNDCTFSRLALVQELVCPGRDESSGQSANSFASQGSGSAPPTTQTGLPSSYGKSDRASDAASISARLRRAHNSKVFDKDSAGAPVWALSFSPDGQYLAAGSQDGVLAIWVVAAPRHDDSPDDSARRFGSDPAIQSETEPNLRNIRTRTLSQSSDSFTIAGAPQSTPSSASIRQQGFPSSVSRLLINDRSYRSDLMTSRLAASPSRETFASSNSSSASQAQAIPQAAQLPPLQTQSEILRSQPLRVFKAHTHAITSIAWSKGGFLVSASMDCTVHLWHVSCMDFLCVFHHNDCVTSVCFHPKDERLFLSGSLDGQLHLWSIQDKRVRSRNEIHRSAVTAVTFSRDGNTVVAGTMQGDCVFYETQGLKYNTQIQVVTPSTLKSSKDVKITSIVPLPPSPGDAHQDEKFLVASTDSRVRIINSRDKSLLRKFRGAELRSAYLAASASDDGDYIICPSEDRQVLIWDAEPGEQSSSFANMLGGMKWQVDASKNWGVERFTASDVFVTAATFAPRSTSLWLTRQPSPPSPVASEFAPPPTPVATPLWTVMPPTPTLATQPAIGSASSIGRDAGSAAKGLADAQAATPSASATARPPGASAVDGMIIVVADALGRIRIFQNGTSGAGTGGSPSASGASNASSIRKEPSRLGKFRAPIRIRPSGSIKPGASADADHTESSSQ